MLVLTKKYRVLSKDIIYIKYIFSDIFYVFCFFRHFFNHILCQIDIKSTQIMSLNIFTTFFRQNFCHLRFFRHFLDIIYVPCVFCDIIRTFLVSSWHKLDILLSKVNLCHFFDIIWTPLCHFDISDVKNRCQIMQGNSQ